jgi:hypothetical protein
MFIVWRKKVITSDRKTELFHTYTTFGERFKEVPEVGGLCWAPLYCEHTGTGRIAWTPLLIHMERVDGKPRQKMLRKFPSLRSCCMADKSGFVLAAWWHCIEDWQQRIKDIGDTEEAFFQRDRKAILAKLRTVAPKPSKAGAAAFAAYLYEKEAPARAFRKAFWDGFEKEQNERKERTECWTILGLKPNASRAEIDRAWRALAMKHHPDRGGDIEEFKRLQRAFELAVEILRQRGA